MHLAQFGAQRRRRHGEADAQPGRVQGLAEGEHGDAARAQLRVRQHARVAPAVEHHVLVDLVGNDPGPAIAQQRRQLVEVRALEAGTGRILR